MFKWHFSVVGKELEASQHQPICERPLYDACFSHEIARQTFQSWEYPKFELLWSISKPSCQVISSPGFFSMLRTRCVYRLSNETDGLSILVKTPIRDNSELTYFHSIPRLQKLAVKTSYPYWTARSITTSYPDLNVPQVDEMLCWIDAATSSW